MTGFIPEEKISETKNSADIVDIISETVFLKKAGSNYVGLCPFHSEKTPSFTVSPDKQIFYCFGCGAGGNVFSFLMKQDGLSFIETVRQLARRFGVDIPDQRMSPELKKKIQEKDQLFAINKAAAEYFTCCLNGPMGKEARDYLEKRGIERQSIDAFQLGFAPPGWDNLVRFFSRRKSPSELVKKAGLIVPRKSRGFYDQFRNRVMFPIQDSRRQFIGFGGRVTDDVLPKYLNSPETPIFNKRRSLYGLNLSRQACRQSGEAYMVEGYFDVISLYQSGIKNVAATLGTSLTIDHVRLLKGIARRVILVFDSDVAGIKAAQRSIRLFMQESMEAKVMVLPQGYDPDSFIQEHGREAFAELAGKASAIVPFLIESAISRHGLSVEGKLGVISDMKEPLRAFDDPVARSLYIKELAERIDIDESVVLKSVRNTGIDTGKKTRKPLAGGGQQAISEKGIKDQIQAPDKAENKIIAMMLQRPEMLSDIIDNNVLEYFENDTLKAIGLAVIRNQDPQKSEHLEIFSCLENEKERNLAASLAMGDEDSWDENGCRMLIFQFVSARRNRLVKALIQKIQAAENENDFDLVRKLLQEKQKMAMENQQRKMALLKPII